MADFEQYAERDRMPVYHPASNNKLRIGHLEGRFDRLDIPGWTLWAKYLTLDEEVVFGRGYCGRSDDLPDEEVEVVAIAVSSNYKCCLVRRSLAPSADDVDSEAPQVFGFISQQGLLCWDELCPDAVESIDDHDQLATLLQENSKSGLKRMHTSVRDAAGVGRAPGESRRSRNRRLQEQQLAASSSTKAVEGEGHFLLEELASYALEAQSQAQEQEQAQSQAQSQALVPVPVPVPVPEQEQEQDRAQAQAQEEEEEAGCA